ncbi:MAG: hypothetical protein B6U85_04835 [Desulfurococcales archaeon ex4484_42]|nr:MAG: hypothetical protein B6U85_04835 [Desulfurococcales archaeon ex4484_42]
MSCNIDEVIRSYICKHKWILDVGSGSGSFIKRLLNICNSHIYVIGIDIDEDRLRKAKTIISDHLVDLITCDASNLSVRSESIDIVTLFLTLHEIEENLVDNVLSEIRRVMRVNGILFFVDKFLFNSSSPNEKLTLLTEEAYHKALEYVEGVKLWGLRNPDEYINKLKFHGFMLVLNCIAQGKYIDGKTFINSWGRDTMRLLRLIKDDQKKEKLNELINRIRVMGSKYGYGPAKLLVAILCKLVK